MCSVAISFVENRLEVQPVQLTQEIQEGAFEFRLGTGVGGIRAALMLLVASFRDMLSLLFCLLGRTICSLSILLDPCFAT